MKIEITPEIKEWFLIYRNKNQGWGSLHIVLDDNNIKDSSVLFCEKYAKDKNDIEGEELAKILLQRKDWRFQEW